MNVGIFVLVVLLNGMSCSRILLVFPMPARSHYILGNALAKGLAEAGHDVTMVSPFEEKNPPKNGTYRDIVLTGLLDEIFNNDALNGLAYHFKAPLIYFSSQGPNPWINSLVGNPSPPSYIPANLLKYTSDMTFFQRVRNWLYTIGFEVYRNLFFYPQQNRILRKYLPHLPDLSVVSSNSSIVLLNNHESTNQALPHVPSMIDIGGFHVKPPKELPKDLKEFMDNAKEGVVYFSMGSNIVPSQMPAEKKEAILKALGKLKQKVLWKWNEDTLPGKPDNVMLSKWFPQPDILAHPNTKLFITHGGLLSATETIYHGVPVLVFPIFGDQKMNAARAEMNGFGLTLPFSEITEQKLTDALDKLLNDPKYRNNAKWRSKLLHDRPVKPMDLAVYWTEFVIRHRGAPHLKVAGVDLPLYKYLLLDVIAFVASISFGVIYAVYIIVKRICCNRKKRQIKLKTN